MKILSILLLICTLGYASGVEGQSISVNISDGTIRDVLDEIETQSNFRFAYSSKFVDMDKKVSVNEKEIELEQLLKKVFSNTSLNYKVEGNVIVLHPRAMNEERTQLQQVNGEVTGKVIDSSKAPLPGVTIVIKGTTKGVITDADGNYLLTNISEGEILKFSFVGMIDQEVVYNGQTRIDIKMQEDAIGLEEVVAIGYGIIKKSDVTGAVTSVNTDEITKTQNTSIAQAIQGRAAGVQVTKSSGSPGATPTVRIRGTGTVNDADPLYVVDGVPITDISTLNMEDAETIEVLKDASATAIYGSRGANGVILITTKSGKSGIPVISYTNYVGIQRGVDNLEVMNAEQWATLHNEARDNDGNAKDPALANPSELESYNWKDLAYRNALIQNHQVSVSGGTDKMTYFISLGYIDQEGILKGSSYQRTNFRVNNTYQIKEGIKVGHNIQYAHSNTDAMPSYGNSTSRVSFIGYIADPVSPIYNEDGSFSSPKYNSFMGNPLGIIKYRSQNSIKESLLGNMFLEADIISGLKFKSNYGMQINFNKSDNFTPIHDVSPVFLSDVTKYSLSRSQNTSMVMSNTLNYLKTIADKHSINALLGQEIQEQKFNNISAGRENIPASVENPTLGSGTVESATNDGTISSSRLSSFFGRLNYNFDERYLVTATYRFDGSSKFGANNKWAKFPSAALGWNIHNEDFFNSNKINKIKLRLGLGATGNDNIPGTATHNVLSIGENAVFANDATELGVAPLRNGNPDLKWETTVTKNVGLDLAMFKNSLTLTAEYFLKNTTDMLLETPSLTSDGYKQSPYTNVGDIENKGFEFIVNYKKQIKDFYFSVGGNITSVKNKVTRLASEGGVILAGTAVGGLKNFSRTVAGGSIGDFYGYKVKGIFQTQEEIDNYAHLKGTLPGDVKYADISGPDGKPDGVIDNNDITKIGSPLPDFTYGINLNIEYKQWDFSAFFQGSQGNDIFNSTLNDLMGNTQTNFSTKMLGRWTGPGTSNEIPRITETNMSNNNLGSERYIQDGSYLRLKNTQLGYTVPSKIIQKTFITKARIYVAVQNLFTITKYEGVDPELGIDPGRSGGNPTNNLAIGIDEGRYPTARTFSIGLNVNF